VTGSLPDGLTLPVRIFASAVAPPSPGSHISTIAGALSAHGVVIAAPALTTTAVFGLAARTASTSLFWSPGRSSEVRSYPSPSVVDDEPTNTTAASAPRAAATASSNEGSGSRVPKLRYSYGVWPFT